MKTERKAAKVVEDVFGDVIAQERLGHYPNKRERRAIRRVLKMTKDAPWPHCKHRERRKARALDRALGITLEQEKANLGVHTKSGHVCAECRCTNVAGKDSRGSWYWEEDNKHGYGEVGHYGVGPCWNHGPHNIEAWNGCSLDAYRETIISDIETMQQVGAAQDSVGAYMVRAEQSVSHTTLRNDIRSSLETTKATVNELVEKLNSVGSGDEKKADFLEDLHTLYATRDGDDDDFDDLVWRHIQSKCPLTERGAKGTSMPMTDHTAYRLKLDFLKSIATIAKGDFDVSKGDYAHSDVINNMIFKFMKAVEMIYKPKGDIGDWDKLRMELKGILMSMNAADGAPLFTNRSVLVQEE